MEADNKMVYRFLGKTGMKVSILGFGNMFISSENSDEENEARTLECLKICKEAGINFFDTAESYGFGKCETTLGKCLTKLGWDRKDFVLTTKLYSVGTGPNEGGLSRKHIIEGIKNSLKRLQVDYVDIVFAHRYDSCTPLEETCRAFDWIIRNGYAHYWGTSEFEPTQIMETHAICEKFQLIHPVAEQPEYSMLWRQRVELDLDMFYDSVYGLGTTVWGPVAAGFLSGKYNSQPKPEGSRFKRYEEVYEALPTSKRIYEGDYEKAVKKSIALEEYAKELGYTEAQLALAWVMRNSIISVALMGASKPEQILSNIKAIELYHKWTPEIEDKCEQILNNEPKPLFNWREWKYYPARRKLAVRFDS